MQRWLLALGLGFITVWASAQPQNPEPASGYATKAATSFKRQAVSAAHPLAAEAGLRILRAGGNAVDAAVAVQMVLGLVEPQSSGIGGGAFLLHFDGRQVQTYDGRETAPAAATPELFLRDGRPMPMREAVQSGLSAGVPGAIAMLALAHERQGQLAWARLFEPAIELAERGFAITPRLHTLLKGDAALKRDAQARALYYDAAGQALPVGHVLRNPAYAEVLRRVAKSGPKAFYEGEVAADIVRRLRAHERPGVMTKTDLAAYRPLERPPMCNTWRELRLCGMGPPSSGHVALMQMLTLLEASAPAAEPEDAWLHRMIEATKLAFADRAQYLADPAFAPAPGGDWQTLLAPDYLRERATLIGPRAMPPAAAGQPAPQRTAYAPQAQQLESGTSHVSIVDAKGHAVAMTTSVESAFGNRVMSDGGTGLAGGFLLNNQLTDFSLAPTGADGRPVANRVEPGKRPRSSMTPTLVFKGERLVLVAGSPGGPAIIPFMTRFLTGHLVGGLPAQAAAELPHLINFNGPEVYLEAGRFSAAQREALQARGHKVAEFALPSGIQALSRLQGDSWAGAADPRREGVSVGD
ncbi:gamma-glutamyltransferase [Roseateles sp.]|uniref:gamma-glutamyltransferase n=1 Tax=Roseateles sp. TaxID=1971397 RepID=UPI003931B145